MATRTGVGDAQAGSILLVVHDFVARSTDELSLAKGDRIELTERDDEFGDGWYLGKHLTNGKSGLFPAVYTTSAPKGTLTNINKIIRGGENGTKPTPTTASTAAQVATTPAVTMTAPPSVLNPPATPASSQSAVSSQSPLAQATLRASVGGATPPARPFAVSNDSPVMNETLSVIDEHITDMRATPRSSYANGNKRDTMTSVYSTQPLNQHTYIAGHETDEEEQHADTEEEIMAWGPDRMAEYLEDNGVEAAHCKVFKEQDISGEVFLAMDQNSLFIKEFDLGSVGRRLKTWHKVKALQDEIRQRSHPDPARSASNYSIPEDEAVASDATTTTSNHRNRASTMGSTLPRALTTASKSSPRAEAPATRAAALSANRNSLNVSPLQNATSLSREDSTLRPSAQNIRNMNHSRRHSSIASIESLTADSSRAGAKKRDTSESRWQPSQTTLNGKGAHGYTTSVDSQFPSIRHSAAPSSPGDFERGYFSSTEVDDRNRRRNLLTKRTSTAASPGHSRNSSSVTANRASIVSGSTVSTREPMTPIVPPGSQSTTQSSRFSAFRSATTPPHGKTASSPRSNVHPVVTKLDADRPTMLDAITASPLQEEENSSANASASPSGFGRSLFASAKAKVTGFRSTSEAVTKDEKSIDRSPTMIRDRFLGSPTGASTPSTEDHSLELSKAELSKSELASRASTGSGGNLAPPPPRQRRPRAKSKKFTSAYTKGLEKKAPSEQMLSCDYSGWMKKKSGSLMTTWKPRLFVLRGRRLSYYYSDQDTEEKGLIDISFHRVLPATNEMLPALHATFTRAAGSPSSPPTGSNPSGLGHTPTIAEQDLRNFPPAAIEAADDEGLFIFKLVPPKSGLAKGVNFTKPTVHYFAVNSRQEGRLWMAALMKATIERDSDHAVTTTYNQKTISLAKARARRERPPALRELADDNEDGEEHDHNDDDDDDATTTVAEDSLAPGDDETGLGIGGLDSRSRHSGAAAEDDDDDATPGAERDGSRHYEDGNSTFASTIATVARSDGTEEMNSA